MAKARRSEANRATAPVATLPEAPLTMGPLVVGGTTDPVPEGAWEVVYDPVPVGHGLEVA